MNGRTNGKLNLAPCRKGRAGDNRAVGIAAAGWGGLALLLALPVGCAGANEKTVKRALDERGEPFSDAEETHPDDTALPDGTLESCTAYAMKHSAALEARFARWRAAVHRIAQARRLPDPVVSYAYYVRRVETRVGPQRHRLSLKQTFPWPTRLSAGADAASAEARALQRQFDAGAIAVQAATAKQYWSIWGVQTARKIHEDHLAILRGLSESAGALLMTGRIELADRQQIDLAAARTEDLLYALDEKAAKLKAQLRGVIGAPPSMPVTAVSTPEDHDMALDEQQLVEWVRNHPSIGAYGELAEASAAAAKQERASRFPSFSLGVDWIETGESDMPDVADSGKDAVLVGVGVSLPLWQRNYKESVAARRAKADAHRADGRAAADRAIADFYAVLADLRDAKRRMALYETTLVPQAESVYESVLGTYMTRKGSIASLLLAERDLLELKVELVEIRTRFAVKWAALENLVGREVGGRSGGGAAGAGESAERTDIGDQGVAQ